MVELSGFFLPFVSGRREGNMGILTHSPFLCLYILCKRCGPRSSVVVTCGFAHHPLESLGGSATAVKGEPSLEGSRRQLTRTGAFIS